MTISQYLSKLSKRVHKSRIAVAEKQMDYLKGYVPIDKGDLRASLRVEDNGLFGGVSIVTGGANLPYTRKQYFEEQRHGGSRGQYTQLQPEDTQISAPRWYEAIIRDGTFKGRLAKTYANSMRLKV